MICITHIQRSFFIFPPAQCIYRTLRSRCRSCGCRIFALGAEVFFVFSPGVEQAVIVFELEFHRLALIRYAGFIRHFALHALIRQEVPPTVLDEVCARLDKAERDVLVCALPMQRAHPVVIGTDARRRSFAAADNPAQSAPSRGIFHLYGAEQGALS